MPTLARRTDRRKCGKAWRRRPASWMALSASWHALDWLDLKGPDKALVAQWLDGVFGDPMPIARGKRAPESAKAKPEDVERFTAIWREARALIDEERFLNWQITFPGVWANWGSAGLEGGFDAVVGNPPWDRIKLQQVEWFAARRPDIAKAQRASDRKRMIGALNKAGDPLHADFVKADRRAARHHAHGAQGRALSTAEPGRYQPLTACSWSARTGW